MIERSESTRVLALPEDILIPIFGNFRHGEDDKIPECNAHRDLVLATHVCQYWRCVAINTASLWNHVKATLNSYKHVGAFLVRSKNLPLSISLYVVDRPVEVMSPPPTDLLTTLDLISENWVRVVSLSLFMRLAHNSDILSIIRKWLGHFDPDRNDPAPLRTLRIDGWTDFKSKKETLLIPELIYQSLGCLKLLSISDSTMPKQLELPKGLTKLSLDAVYMASSDPKLDELLRALPDLEVLHLRLCRIGGSAFASSEQIQLPYLRLLFLMFSGDPSTCSLLARLLQIMEFPPDTNCKFSFKDCTPLGALLKIPHHIVSTLLTPEIIFTSNKYSNKFTFRAFRSAIGLAKPAEVIITELPAVDLRSKRNILETLGRCFNALPWTHPVCLRLDLSVNGGTIREGDWVRFATYIPTLESLEVRFTRISDCEEEQAVQSLVKGLEKERKEPCCPRLRRLLFPAIDGGTLWKQLSVILKRWNRQRKTQDLPSIAVTFLGGPVELVMEFECSD